MTALVICLPPALMIFVIVRTPSAYSRLLNPSLIVRQIANLPGLGYLQLLLWLPSLSGPLLCTAWREASLAIVRAPNFCVEVLAATFAPASTLTLVNPGWMDSFGELGILLSSFYISIEPFAEVH